MATGCGAGLRTSIASVAHSLGRVADKLGQTREGLLGCKETLPARGRMRWVDAQGCSGVQNWFRPGAALVASTQKRRSLEIGATRMKTVRSLVLRTQSVVPDLHPVRRDIRRRPCGSSRRRRRRGECSRARRLACQCPETHEAKRNEHMYSQTQLIVRHR